MPKWQSDDAEWLENQYFPWSWSDLNLILSNWTDKSKAYLDRASLKRDLRYGDHEHELLDFLQPQRDNAPILIFIHGGYWQWIDKDHYTFALEPLVNAGALVANVNYALCPEVDLQTQINQIRTACAWVWRHASEYGGNPEQLHIAGHSAGGHLAAMMVVTEWPMFAVDLPRDLIKSAVLVSGLFDLAPLRYVSVTNALNLTMESAKQCSPLFIRPLPDIPISVIVGEEETQEFQRQSETLVEQWSESVDTCNFVKVPGDDHFTVIERMLVQENPVTTTLLNHLWLLE